jgi:hypothetical protein
MTKTKANPAVTRELRQTGVLVYEVHHIDPNAPGGMEALVESMNRTTPHARLERIKKRAVAYADVADLQREIREIEDVIGRRDFSRAIGYMLLATERGLDLLDTGRLIPKLVREQRFASKHGAKEVLSKNKYIAEIGKQFAGQPNRHRKTTDFIWHNSPKVDDGESFFYWVGLKFFDRDEPDRPLTFPKLRFRVQKACSVPRKKKVGKPS